MSKKDLLALRTAFCASGVGSSGVAGATLDECSNYYSDSCQGGSCPGGNCYIGCSGCTYCSNASCTTCSRLSQTF